MLFVGIDPGLDGAVVVLGPDLSIQHTFLTRDATIAKPSKGRTYDYRAMGRALEVAAIAVCVIEEPRARQMGNSATGMLSIGTGFGLWWGLVAGRQPLWKIITVAPRQWHIRLFGRNAGGDPKARAHTYALSNIPSLDSRCGGRLRKPHQGIIDAACLAHYGRLINGGINQ